MTLQELLDKIEEKQQGLTVLYGENQDNGLLKVFQDLETTKETLIDLFNEGKT